LRRRGNSFVSPLASPIATSLRALPNAYGVAVTIVLSEMESHGRRAAHRIQSRQAGDVDAQGIARRRARAAHGNGYVRRVGLEPATGCDPAATFPTCSSPRSMRPGRVASAASRLLKIRPGSTVDSIEVTKCRRGSNSSAPARNYAGELALSEVTLRALFGTDAISRDRHQSAARRLASRRGSRTPVPAVAGRRRIRLCRLLFGAEYAEL